MKSSRFLIINADDLGISHEVNQGIFTAHKKGVITDASLLIKGPYCSEAIAMIKNIPSFQVGIHIDLDPVLGWKSPGRERLTRSELRAMMDAPGFGPHVKREIDEQIRAFLDAGLTPSHIDTHHHVHGFPQIFDHLVAAMERYGIKAIRFSKTGYALLGREDILLTTNTTQRMEEKLRAQGIVYPHLLIDPRMPFSLKELPPGVTELMVHPGVGGDQWRQRDFEMIMDPGFKKTLHDEAIQLIGFAEIDIN